MLVLTYHSISQGPPPLCVPAQRMAEQLDFLLDSGYRACALDEWVAQPTAAADTQRFAITFDDGYRDIEQALPVLAARGLRATLFAAASEGRDALRGGIDAPLLSPDELRQLPPQGISIGAHGVEHVELCTLDDAALERELSGGKQRLAEWLGAGASVDLLAYPYGAFDRRVCAAAARHFRAAFTTQLARVDATRDPLALPRVDAFYLDFPGLRRALVRGRADTWLAGRRWLRRLRGSEPRRPLPRRARSAAAPFSDPGREDPNRASATEGAALRGRYGPCL